MNAIAFMNGLTRTIPRSRLKCSGTKFCASAVSGVITRVRRNAMKGMKRFIFISVRGRTGSNSRDKRTSMRYFLLLDFVDATVPAVQGGARLNLPEAVATKWTRLPLDRDLLWRICLVPVAVAICHFFAWDFLRSLTTGISFQSAAMFGVHGQRLAPDLVMYDDGKLYRIVTTCTGIDAWCGAIPL